MEPWVCLVLAQGQQNPALTGPCERPASPWLPLPSLWGPLPRTVFPRMGDKLWG